jgi:RNA polymerase sigma-70 factor (ECF subfamily)
VKSTGLRNQNELIPTRQSLLSRLKDSTDQESWREFFDIYWELIYRTGVKAGLTDSEAQDMVQETMLAVVNSMPTFEYRKNHASFKSWLLRLTSWRVADQFRKRKKASPQSRHAEQTARTSTRTSTVEQIADPASLDVKATWDEDWEMTLMEAALARVKKKVDPKMYQVFDCYVFKEWSVSRVARALKINPAQVYLVKHRVQSLIKKEVALLQSDALFAR